MSTAAVARTYLPPPSSAVNRVEDDIKAIVHKELGTDFASFNETPGKIGQAFSQAYTLWRSQIKHTEFDSCKDPQTRVWRSILFMPLINEGLRSNRAEDLCLLYVWIHTCRYVLGSDEAGYYHDEIDKTLKEISAKLHQHIGNDSKKIVLLFEYLSKRSTTIHSSGNQHECRLDSSDLGKLCRLLCQFYYYNHSATLKDLTELCHADIWGIATNHPMSDFDCYLNFLIVYKAQLVLSDASPEDQKAFLDAFRKIGESHLMKKGCLNAILEPFFKEATPENMKVLIFHLGSTLPRNHNIQYGY